MYHSGQVAFVPYTAKIPVNCDREQIFYLTGIRTVYRTKPTSCLNLRLFNSASVDASGVPLSGKRLLGS
jgi:hypothetical protein